MHSIDEYLVKIKHYMELGDLTLDEAASMMVTHLSHFCSNEINDNLLWKLPTELLVPMRRHLDAMAAEGFKYVIGGLGGTVLPPDIQAAEDERKRSGYIQLRHVLAG